ncbi:hypothetical protein CAI21_01745 [Alkalilimnicola ehrlichii]|uniref:Outer membrane protein beta-barrel domain-containing protein n=1 Tax=Alkalilimnicola ehrlichii TaxID=351052 RepID=A0A3E0X2U2_9GAMM|nr:hypothetical protein [Alkalilimnicola ehrlichii]RFA31368.1 hypothetical protein CAI21_01745 [Alkalilimnicola ehrlichii]RFA39358.1 hypothetical protein CAL65_00660 [Alkalilimnicola ehrlichii]
MLNVIRKPSAVLGSLGLAAALAVPATVSAQDLELGIGAQYQLADPLLDDGRLSAIELRGWQNEQLGFGVFGYYGSQEEGGDDEVIRFGGKVMYAPIVNPNSRFYVGLEAAYEDWNDLDGFSVMPLAGFEYRLANAPEIGLNLEVGYRYLDIDNGTELEQHGISSQIGATYYF